MSQRQEFLLVLALGALVFIVGLGRRQLWNPLEPRYAGITLDMVQENHWLVPHYRQEPYTQKPPLLFWCSALLMKASGETQNRFLLRLPSALGGILALIATWGLGRKLFGGRSGIYAAAVFATCWVSFWSGRFFHLDLPFVGATCAGLWGLIEAGGGSAARRRWLLLATASLAAAILIKGPPALLILAVAAAPSLLFARKTALIRGRDLLVVTLVALIPFLVWLAWAASQAGEAWLQEIVVGQGITRHIKTPKPDRHGPLFYLGGIWGALAPWSLLLIPALGRAFEKRRDPRLRGALLLSATWLIGLLLILSFGAMRRSRYLLLVLPAAAMLIGWWLEQLRLERVRGRGGPRLLGFCNVLVLCAAGLVGAALVAAHCGLISFGDSPKLQRALQVVSALPVESFIEAALLLSTALWGLRTLLKKGLIAAFAPAAISLALVASVYSLIAGPAIDAVRQDPQLIARLDEFLTPQRRLLILGTYAYHESTEGWFHYYSGHHPKLIRHPMHGLAEAAKEGSWLLVVRDRDLRPHKWRIDPSVWTPLIDHPLGHHHLWLFANPYIAPP